MVGEMHKLRIAFAGLIGAQAGEIALTDNTCRAANIAVRILEARPGGNVVVDDSTYPSSVYPWRAHGRHDVRYVPTDGVDDAVAAIAAQIDDQTVAVCVTHVAPFTGRRHDIAAIAEAAHAHGALVLVDAAQSAGVVPIDVRAAGVDMLVTTGMKWLLGPPGMGYLFVSPGALADAPVLDVGYVGLDTPVGDWPVGLLPPISPEARRYELGLPSLPALTASRAGIELLLSVGIERIAAHVEALVSRCMDALTERGADLLTPMSPHERAGVIAFRSDSAGGLFAACRTDAVDVGALINGIRVDPHGFNSDEDIDRFLESYDRFQVR